MTKTKIDIGDLSEMIGDYGSGIYIIFNIITSDFYVGSTNNFHHRYTKHISTLKCGTVSIKLRNAITKYGIENFRFLILEEIQGESELQERENYWILNAHPAYNHKVSTRRFVFTEERNKKIGETLSIVAKRGIDSPKYGTKRSEEIKERIRKTMQARKDDPIFHRNSSPVIQYSSTGEFISKYKSVSEAARLTGIPRRVVSKYCNGYTGDSIRNPQKFIFRHDGTNQ